MYAEKINSKNIFNYIEEEINIDEDKKHYNFEYNKENEIIEAMKKIKENIIDKTLKKL